MAPSQLALLESSPKSSTIQALQYEIKLLRSENALLETSKDEEISKLQKKYLKATQTHQESLSLQSFINTENTNLKAKVSSLSNKNKDLMSENATLKSKINEMSALISRQKTQLQDLRDHTNTVEFKANEAEIEHRRLNAQAAQKIRSLEAELGEARLQIKNKETSIISAENEQFPSSVIDKVSSDAIRESAALQVQLLSAEAKIESAKVDSSLIKILQEKLNLLMKRVSMLQDVVTSQANSLAALTSEKVALKKKIDALCTIFHLDKETFNFSENTNALLEKQLARHSLEIEIEALRAELKGYKEFIESERQKTAQAQISLEKLTMKYEHMRDQKLSLNDRIVELQQQIQGLQKKNQRLEEIANLVKKSPFGKSQPTEDIAALKSRIASQNEQISTLENTISEYIKSKEHDSENTTNKKHKLNDGSCRPSLVHQYKDQLNNFDKELSELRIERAKLEKHVSELQTRIGDLEKELRRDLNKELEEAKLKILQLYSDLDPLHNYQKAKNELLRSLRAENEALKQKIIENPDSDKSIPIAVFDRYLVEYKNNEEEIASLNKKLDRLKKVYQSKTKEVLETILVLFGYEIETIENSKSIKLLPKLDSAIRNSKNYIIVNSSGSLQLSRNADEAFVKICENLVEHWVKEKKQIPGLLALLCLERLK